MHTHSSLFVKRSTALLAAVFLALLQACTSTPSSNATQEAAPPAAKAEASVSKPIQMLPIPDSAPEKSCAYDINAYFSELQQWEMGFGQFTNWLQRNIVGGSKSPAAKAIIHQLHTRVNAHKAQPGKHHVLRAEIPAQLIKMNRAFEVEWYLHKALELSLIPTGYEQKMFTPNSQMKVNIVDLYCDITP